MPRLVALIFLLCCLSGQIGNSTAAVRLTPKTQSVELAPQITVLEDAGGGLTLADVQRRAAEFRPSGVREDAAINFGYSSSAWWLRIDLAADPEAARDWLLDFLQHRAAASLGAPLATLARAQEAAGELALRLLASRTQLAAATAAAAACC